MGPQKIKMFATAHKAAKEIVGNQRSSEDELSAIPPGSLPERYSLSQLHANLCTSQAAEKQEEILLEILILRSCLHQSTRLTREPGDDAFVDQLSLWLSKGILPSSSVISRDDITSNASYLSREETLRIARQKGIAGLSTLQSLLSLYTKSPSILDPQILLSLIAFTSARDPWTTPLAVSNTTSVLSKHAHQTHTPSFIIDYILQQFIRPLFAKSKPEAITASGRKAMPSSAPPRRFESADQELTSKRWMYQVPYTITVFEWIVANSSTEIATSHFNLYTPPLLTLLDSTDTLTRSRALSILSTFLPLLTPKLLKLTGLGEVFEDAVTPTLMLLPNLTPVNESVQLLEPAYHALIVLGGTLYDTVGNEVSKEERGKELDEKEMKFWDRVLRKGILMGYVHANEHAAIVEVLVRNLGLVIAKMGMNAVKHLKDVLPIISTVLTDPFAPSSPSLLLVTLKTLQTTILNTWPEMSEPGHRIEIIRASTICWSNISEGESGVEDLEEVRKEVRIAGTMLVHAVQGDQDSDIRKELGPLFTVDPSLRQVFEMGGG